jgi:hypothetical protein
MNTLIEPYEGVSMAVEKVYTRSISSHLEVIVDIGSAAAIVVASD